jgi:threonine dehydrogenase-like Zn-dependent dehydrogenase
VAAVCKAGQYSIIGVYPPTDRVFPIGKAMNKNLTVKMGELQSSALLRDPD